LAVVFIFAENDTKRFPTTHLFSEKGRRSFLRALLAFFLSDFPKSLKGERNICFSQPLLSLCDGKPMVRIFMAGLK